MKSNRHFVSGVAFIATFGLLVALTVALYQGSFRSSVPVTVKADRAGLTMSPGAVVKLRGVEVGKVRSVNATTTGADLVLDIDEAHVEWVSRRTTAQIVPPTAFGAKYVQLTSPTKRGQDVITPGSVIKADRVTVEVNEAFQNLAGVLDAAQPDKVNNTITALSEALEGRGNKIGELVSQVDQYLETFNTSLPGLSEDLDKADDVVSVYEKLSPDLIALTRNVTASSDTLVERQKSLNRFTSSLESFSTKTQDFVEDNDAQLVTLLDELDPVTAMLSRYSPNLTCMLTGAVVNGDMAEAVVGGEKPGVNTYTKLQPSDEPYTAPSDFPKIGDDRGPDCFGLPHITQADADKPNPDFGTGANPYAGDPKSPSEELSTTFFGQLAGLVNLG